MCQQDDAVFRDIADAIMSHTRSKRARSKRARTRPWSMVLELSRKDICEAGELDEYFAGLADVVYRALLEVDSDVPESIEIAWPASAYDGVYRSMTYSPAYEDEATA